LRTEITMQKARLRINSIKLAAFLVFYFIVKIWISLY
jgi:hypothetical protein